MTRWPIAARIVLLLLLGLVACSAEPSPEPQPVHPSPTRVDATRWPTRTPTATHTPLPSLTPTATRTPTPTPIPGLLLSGLGILEYPVATAPGGAVRLEDGVSEVVGGRRFALADVVAFGDLDGDGRDDAAVLLVERSEDRTPSYHLQIVASEGGEATPFASLPLGDGLVVRSMVVAAQRLTLDLLAFSDEDAPCCPSLASRRIYALEDATLDLVTQWDGPRQRSVVPEILPSQAVPFAPGTSASVVRGRLNPLGEQRYTIAGVAGQTLEVGVGLPGELVRLSLRGLSDDVVPVSVTQDEQRWSGPLPATQDYELSLVSLSGSATSYAVAVSLGELPLDRDAALTTTVPITVTPTFTATVTPEVLDATSPATALVPITGTPTVTPTAAASVPAGSVLALTFDGASMTPDWVGAVADALVSLGVPGTFFVGGSLPFEGGAEGVESGLWTADALTLDAPGRTGLIEHLDDASGGPEPGTWRCVRPAAGAMDGYTRVLLRERGYEVVLWDVEVEADGTTPLRHLVSPGAILRISAGDDPADTVALLSEAIPDLLDMGYEFVPACHR